MRGPQHSNQSIFQSHALRTGERRRRSGPGTRNHQAQRSSADLVQLENALAFQDDVADVLAFLHRLLHSVFFTNKRVQQETGFRERDQELAQVGCRQTELVRQGLVGSVRLALAEAPARPRRAAPSRAPASR